LDITGARPLADFDYSRDCIGFHVEAVNRIFRAAGYSNRVVCKHLPVRRSFNGKNSDRGNSGHPALNADFLDAWGRRAGCDLLCLSET